MSTPTPVSRCPAWICYLLPVFIFQVALTSSESFNSINSYNSSNANSQWEKSIPVIFDSSSVDSEFQEELLKSALLAFQNGDTSGMQPLLVDFSQLGGTNRLEGMRGCAKSLILNKLKVAVSLLSGEDLQTFSQIYESEAREHGEGDELHIYSPRSILPHPYTKLRSIHVKSLQMSEDARAVALLNRVKNVGVQTLIPVLDGDSESQLEMLNLYHKTAVQTKKNIKFTKSVFLSDPVHSENFQMILKEFQGFHESHLQTLGYHSVPFHEDPLKGSKSDLKPGILLLATNASQIAMQIASQKNHLLLSWFSPNILEFEEWAYKEALSMGNVSSSSSKEISRMNASDSNAGQQNNFSEGPATANSDLFGLYTVNFVGSKGWDNSIRRNMLREFSTFTGPSPRILFAVLTYDAVSLAKDHLKNELTLPKVGLSGIIEFSKKGCRKGGTYLGTSSVPKTASSLVTLLQPSTWILDDVITVKESSIGNHYEISDYDIATSSILPRKELRHIANSTRNEVGCSEHIMNVVTYDPFNQMPYHYFFNEANLPDTLVVPNHQGYGITFVCTHFPENRDTSGERTDTTSSLQLACTPGMRMTQPINCFRSRVNHRQKRATVDARQGGSNPVPSVQYQYSLSGNDPWLSQNSKNQYYYQPGGKKDYNVESATYGYATTRLDIPISEDRQDPLATAAPAPKLPELRQILKAAKPFVGSCIGSSTGCAICVLVLGRLPLGTAPTACTGPCFVGTFGSCGSLLGRVFAETTVICTELFKQGLLDADTFVADAEFGKYMLETSPNTLQGYTLLATPLVTLMKSSTIVTKIVATFALPWAHHMKYLLGRSNDTNTIGSFVHLIGYPICTITGQIYFSIVNFKTHCLAYIFILSPLFTSLMTILLILLLVPNLSSSNVSKHSNKFRSFIVFCTLTSKMKKIVEKVLAYFKAIGKST